MTPRVLVLTANYPSAGFPTRGVWTRRLVQASRGVAEPVVVSPVPWLPVGLRPGQLARSLRIPATWNDDGVPVHHPRTWHVPIHATAAHEERVAYPSVAKLARALHRERPFDVIHAHFIHPEGVMAARLGRALGLPVVTTEHANWTPWLDEVPTIRRRVEGVLDAIAILTAPSEVTAATIRAVVGDRVPVEVLPNGVDETVFRPVAGIERDLDRLVFVGAVRHVKGLDVLIDALPGVVERRPGVRLDVIGESYFPGYRTDEDAVRARIARLGLTDRVRFVGPRSPEALARELCASAALVLPSRRESFGAVLIEAMACGTPVVATRCGGPSEIVTPEVGRLVEPGDSVALADALVDVLSEAEHFDRRSMRARTVERYGVEATRVRLGSLYTRAGARERRAP